MSGSHTNGCIFSRRRRGAAAPLGAALSGIAVRGPAPRGAYSVGRERLEAFPPEPVRREGLRPFAPYRIREKMPLRTAATTSVISQPLLGADALPRPAGAGSRAAPRLLAPMTLWITALQEAASYTCRLSGFQITHHVISQPPHWSGRASASGQRGKPRRSEAVVRV